MDDRPRESQNDFDNSQVSKLLINRQTGGVLNGSFAIPSSAGFQRFCSNFLATAAEGFDREILFTNEEAIDFVFREEDAWPPPIGDPDEKQAGLAVALDVKAGTFVAILGMGRHNHENSVAIPGFDDLVILSGDDTFTSGPLTDPTVPPTVPPTLLASLPVTAVFVHRGLDTGSVLADEGDLWAFHSTTAGFDDYYDFTPGSTADIAGEFIEVPRNIATGLDSDGSELKAADVGFPLPPNDGSWQRDIRTQPPTTGLDGPQWVLGVLEPDARRFQLRPGRGRRVRQAPGHGERRLRHRLGPHGRRLQAGRSTNGRIWRLELDPDDLTQVDSMRIFVDGDDFPVQTPTEIHQPDNLESTEAGLIVTEDPGSSQQFPVTSMDPNRTTARLWFVPSDDADPMAAGTPAIGPRGSVGRRGRHGRRSAGQSPVRRRLLPRSAWATWARGRRAGSSTPRRHSERAGS